MNFADFATTNQHVVEYVAAIVEFGIHSISDALYKPFKQMGSTNGVSMGVRKDVQIKYVKECQTYIDQSVKVFVPISPDGVAWIEHQKGDVISKFSLEMRISQSTPAWQARMAAEHALERGEAPRPSSSDAGQRPQRKSSIAAKPSPSKAASSSSKKAKITTKTETKVHAKVESKVSKLQIGKDVKKIVADKAKKEPASMEKQLISKLMKKGIKEQLNPAEQAMLLAGMNISNQQENLSQQFAKNLVRITA